jgi:hypothetical protein
VQDYVRFVGRDPQNKQHDDLVMESVKVRVGCVIWLHTPFFAVVMPHRVRVQIYSQDMQSLQRFEAQHQTGRGGFPPPGGGGYPPAPFPTAGPYGQGPGGVMTACLSYACSIECTVH